MKPFPLRKTPAEPSISFPVSQDVAVTHEYMDDALNTTATSSSSSSLSAELGLCGMFQNPSQAQGAFVQEPTKGLLSPSALQFYYPEMFQSTSSSSSRHNFNGRNSSSNGGGGFISEESWQRWQVWWQRRVSLSRAYWELHGRDTLLGMSLGLIFVSLLLLAYSFCLDRLHRSRNLRPNSRYGDHPNSTTEGDEEDVARQKHGSNRHNSGKTSSKSKKKREQSTAEYVIVPSEDSSLHHDVGCNSMETKDERDLLAHSYYQHQFEGV